MHTRFISYNSNLLIVFSLLNIVRMDVSVKRRRLVTSISPLLVTAFILQETFLCFDQCTKRTYKYKLSH